MFLTVPPQKPLPGVDTRPGAVRKWIDNLAYTNTQSTAHQVIERLRDLHHQKLDAGQRHELMLGFLNAFHRLHEPLRSQAGTNTEPAASRLQTLDRLTEELLIECKYVINDAQQARSLLRKPRARQQAVPLAMHLISLLLTTRYQSYLPTDSQLWREAGMLLRHAAEQRLSPADLGTPVPLADQPLDAASLYALMAIVRLTDPFRLPQGMLWETFSFLSTHRSRLGIQPDEPDSPHARAVCITCEPTEWHHRPPDDADPHDWYWLDLGPVLEAVGDALRSLAGGGTPVQAGLSDNITRQDAVHLLKRLQHQWTHPPERKLPRFEAEQTVHLAVGLEACFYLHNRGTAFDPRDYQELTEDDHIEMSEAQAPHRPATASGFQAYRCSLINRSAGGLAIRLPRDSQLQLRVGELLAVNLNASGDDAMGEWLTASVRWLVNQSPHQEAGLQYIARDVSPCALRLISGSYRNPYQPALETTVEHNHSTYNLIITSKGMYKPGRTLELVRGSQHIQVKCTHLVESSGLYERFCFEPA